MSKHITVAQVQAKFRVPLSQAAKELGVCPGTLQRFCRKHGIKRWPARQVRSLDRRLALLAWAEGLPPQADEGGEGEGEEEYWEDEDENEEREEGKETLKKPQAASPAPAGRPSRTSTLPASSHSKPKTQKIAGTAPQPNSELLAPTLALYQATRDQLLGIESGSRPTAAPNPATLSDLPRVSPSSRLSPAKPTKSPNSPKKPLARPSPAKKGKTPTQSSKRQKQSQPPNPPFPQIGELAPNVLPAKATPPQPSYALFPALPLSNLPTPTPSPVWTSLNLAQSFFLPSFLPSQSPTAIPASLLSLPLNPMTFLSPSISLSQPPVSVTTPIDVTYRPDSLRTNGSASQFGPSSQQRTTRPNPITSRSFSLLPSSTLTQTEPVIAPASSTHPPSTGRTTESQSPYNSQHQSTLSTSFVYQKTKQQQQEDNGPRSRGHLQQSSQPQSSQPASEEFPNQDRRGPSLADTFLAQDLLRLGTRPALPRSQAAWRM